MPQRPRAPRNRTLTLTDEEQAAYSAGLLHLDTPVEATALRNKIIRQDLFEVLPYLPSAWVDLLILDPPYNLTKSFNGRSFNRRSSEQYAAWLETWLERLVPLLKPTASMYLCGDWQSSGALEMVAANYFTLRNRITWEREKGRGAKRNWKNCAEDIWFGTVGKDYTFNVDAVKLKRRVVAPYRHADGKPKDWDETDSGNFRATHPSNLWTDISVPFWSMPENTEHPTQKPEKLIAKLVLASSNEGDMVFDPFLGSGTSAVVAKKLGRNYCGVEIDEYYACLSAKRLARADTAKRIQGYDDGYFRERNTPPPHKA